MTSRGMTFAVPLNRIFKLNIKLISVKKDHYSWTSLLKVQVHMSYDL